MNASVWIALVGVGVTVTANAAALVFVAMRFTFWAGEMKKTLEGHSGLLRLLPCLRPRCPSGAELSNE